MWSKLKKKSQFSFPQRVPVRYPRFKVKLELVRSEHFLSRQLQLPNVPTAIQLAAEPYLRRSSWLLDHRGSTVSASVNFFYHSETPATALINVIDLRCFAVAVRLLFIK